MGFHSNHYFDFSLSCSCYTKRHITLFAKYNTIELNKLTETGCRLWQNKVWFGGMFIYMIVVLAKNIIIVRKDVRSKDVYTKDQKDDNIAFQ